LLTIQQHLTPSIHPNNDRVVATMMACETIAAQSLIKNVVVATTTASKGHLFSLCHHGSCIKLNTKNANKPHDLAKAYAARADIVVNNTTASDTVHPKTDIVVATTMAFEC
jgi:hypothetical protein